MLKSYCEHNAESLSRWLRWYNKALTSSPEKGEGILDGSRVASAVHNDAEAVHVRILVFVVVENISRAADPVIQLIQYKCMHYHTQLYYGTTLVYSYILSTLSSTLLTTLAYSEISVPESCIYSLYHQTHTRQLQLESPSFSTFGYRHIKKSITWPDLTYIYDLTCIGSRALQQAPSCQQRSRPPSRHGIHGNVITTPTADRWSRPPSPGCGRPGESHLKCTK